MKTKSYYYNVNECAKGVFEAKNKKEVRRHCEYVASLFFPTKGIRTLSIKRMRNQKPLIAKN
jgi:hypothetical protein